MWHHRILLITGVCSPSQWCATSRDTKILAVISASLPAVRPMVGTTGSTWTVSIPKTLVQPQQHPMLETCPSKVDVGFGEVIPCKSIVISKVRGEATRSLTHHNNCQEWWDPMGHSLLFSKEGGFINWATPHVKSMDTLSRCQGRGRRRREEP